MARKSNKRVETVFGKEIIVNEQYYLNNRSLPTVDSEYEWTPEMVAALARSKEDIHYFAETFFTIINGDRKRECINLREYQIRMLDSMKNYNRLIFNCSRQIGKSTLMTIYALWLANFYSDQLIIILAHKEKMAKELFSRIKLAYEELPNWVKVSVDNEWNDLSAKFANGSRIITSPTSANAIRGQTASCIILDEFAFVEDSIARDFWTAVTPTLITAPDAKLFVSSTPNGTDNIFYDLVARSEQGKNNFKVEKVIWSDVPGRGAAWKRNVIETELNGDIDRFEQEYECRFLGSSNSAFPIRVFEQLKLDIKEPIQTLYEGNLNIWEHPQTNRVYTMGVDVAEGLGKDASVIQIFDITDLSNIEQVAMYHSNLIDPTDFTVVVSDIAKMYGEPVLSVERNNTRCRRLQPIIL